ncbi:MAG: transcription antitermination factor NusB [Alphaproteobacteria bacterium]|nr:transcription antitermination factor NusB [Alphaproteobacteria bacterium]
MGDGGQAAPGSPRKGAAASARGAARLLAVQALYQIEIRGGTADATILEFLQHRTEQIDEDDGERLRLEADKALFADIVTGVTKSREELMAALDGCLDAKTRAERLEPLLRSILMAGAYELRSRSDIPARASISEYMHLTDAFFDGREPGLVNAVLDRFGRVVREDELMQTEPAGHGGAD